MKNTEVFHPVRIMYDVRIHVTELVWTDGRRSFDVYEEYGFGLLRLLTEAESFDSYPTDAQIANLL